MFFDPRNQPPLSSADAVWQHLGQFAPAASASSANPLVVDQGGMIRDGQNRPAMTFNGGVHMRGLGGGGQGMQAQDMLAPYRGLQNPLLAALS